MSSSYVEVRESENGTGGDFLEQLGINNIMATDSNGIDVQARFDAELPKDHTYNKDPGNNGEQEVSAEGDVKTVEAEATPRRTGRAQRNIKHKIIKPRTEETVVKKDNSSKKSRPKAIVEPLGKKPNQERGKSPVKNKVLAEVNNTSTSESELSPKKDRKRKVEDVADSEVKDKNDVKQSGRKRVKATPEKEADQSDLKEEEEEEEVKKKTPAKKSKGGKAKKKEVKSPKAESPKSVTKPVMKDVGEISLDLPTGWTRKIVERKSGKTAGMFDIYIYSPDGIKFRSRPDIAAYLEKTKSKLSLESFSFKRSLGETLTSNNVKKSVSKTEKAESSSRKKKATTAVKVGKKLKVKIGTPKKHDNKAKDEKKKKVYPVIDCKPSTSGLQSKRIGANRKKKYA